MKTMRSAVVWSGAMRCDAERCSVWQGDAMRREASQGAAERCNVERGGVERGAVEHEIRTLKRNHRVAGHHAATRGVEMRCVA